MPKAVIKYADFESLDLRVGTILEVHEVEGSDKLLRFSVDLGDLPAGGGKRTILSGIRKSFELKDLVGLQVLVLANLEPRKIMGFESEGMILMAVEYPEGAEKVTLLVPQKPVLAGTGVE